MLVPISWLKEYVEFDANPEDLSEKLLLSGTKVEKIIKRDGEVLLSLEITPNRSDCLGIIGIAREVSALYGADLKLPEPFGDTRLNTKRKSVKLDVLGKNLCPYYSIGTISNLKVQESSEWFKKRLELVNIRPINNVVDTTNYVMIETGQPMHAFDFDKLEGKMILRASKEGEKVITLDGVERALNKGTIIVEDSEKLIDLAGLMGGQNTEIDESTSTIVLHVPIYDSVAIRHASQFTDLRSEASSRFEKQLDPNGHRYAFERALHFLKVEASGVLSSDIKSVGYPAKNESFTTSFQKIKGILGIKISENEIVDILVSLGFEVLPGPSFDEKSLEVRPPTWRPDVNITEDIAEEVGRIWGYNRFTKTLPSGQIPIHEDSFFPDWGTVLKETLQALSFSETYSHSMTSASSIEKVGISPKDVLRVSNRMTVDYEYLRPTLMLGLLESVSLNIRNFDQVSLYELGRVFFKEINPKNKLPHQPRKIAAISTSSDFIHIKGVVEQLLGKFNIKDYSFQNVGNSNIWSRQGAKLYVKKIELGTFGSLNSKILEDFSIKEKVFGFELDFEKLISLASLDIHYKPLPKFPTVKEDLSIAVEEKTNVQTILDIAHSLKENRIQNVQIAEIIPWQGKKSVLLNLEYCDSKKTLTDKEVEKIRKKLIEVLKSNLKAEVRSK